MGFASKAIHPHEQYFRLNGSSEERQENDRRLFYGHIDGICRINGALYLAQPPLLA